MLETVEKEAIDCDAAEQAKHVARRQASHHSKAAILLTRMLPVPGTPENACERDMEHDNFWGTQVSFASDEDSMMGQNSKDSSKKYIKRHFSVHGDANRMGKEIEL